jgi:hypothetical protein
LLPHHSFSYLCDVVTPNKDAAVPVLDGAKAAAAEAAISSSSAAMGVHMVFEIQKLSIGMAVLYRRVLEIYTACCVALLLY